MHEVTITRAALADLATLGAIASTDQARPLLVGILFDVKGNTITATATDSYVLAVITREAQSVTGGDFTVLLDAKSLATALKACGKGYGDLDIRFDGDAGVTIGNGGDAYRYPVEVITGNYPDVRQVIPADSFYANSDANTVTLAPHKLAQFAKVAPWNDKRAATPMKIELIDSSRAVRLTAPGTLALIMPVRTR